MPKSVTTTRSLAARHQEDVLALEVAVDDARRVRRRERRGGLAGDRQRLLDRQPAAPLEPRRERLPLEQLHGQEDDRRPIGLGVVADVEDPADVRVGDLARQVDLALEAVDRPLLGGDRRVHRLERDPLAQVAVLRLVDLAHAAAREEADDPVAAGEDGAGLEDGGRRGAAEAAEAAGHRREAASRAARRSARDRRAGRRSRERRRRWRGAGSGRAGARRPPGVALAAARADEAAAQGPGELGGDRDRRLAADALEGRRGAHRRPPAAGRARGSRGRWKLTMQRRS